MSPEKLTGLLLVHREDELAHRALDSLLDVCGQVVVVKDSSNLASEAFGELQEDERIIVTERYFDGSFPEQRNQGIKHALGAWVLSLDSDETLSEELKQELSDLEPSEEVDVYRLTRLEQIAGKLRKHTSVSTGQFHPRLFRSLLAYKPAPSVHERFENEESLTVEDLTAPFIHHNELTVRERFKKAMWYSTSQALTDSSSQTSRIRMALEFPNLLLRRGYIKDGAVGITEAVIQTLYMFNRHRKQLRVKPDKSSVEVDLIPAR